MIKNFFRGGELRIQSIDVEIEAYSIMENKIHNLFDASNIDSLYKQKVTDCFDVIKENFKNDGESLSEGKVYIGEKRVRAEYLLPIKLLIILDENKVCFSTSCH